LSLIPILTAAVYAGLRLAYSGFYDRLGVSPEEVGLGQVDLVVRSIGLIALTAVTAVTLVIFIVLVVVALSAATGASKFVDWVLEKAPRWAALVLIVSLTSWFLGLAFLPSWLRQYLFYAPAAALLLAGPVGYLLFPELRGRHVERARAMVSQLWVVGTVAVGALSVAFITAITVILAPAAAHGVQDGRSYRDWSVPWRADPVTVVWLQQGAGTDPLGAHCLMYLGQANGIAVLYDVDTHQSVRLASAGVLLLIDSSSDRCRRT